MLWMFWNHFQDYICFKSLHKHAMLTHSHPFQCVILNLTEHQFLYIYGMLCIGGLKPSQFALFFYAKPRLRNTEIMHA